MLDNASDFLEDIDEDYEPDKKKPRWEDWNPPGGGAFGSKENSLDLVDAILDNLNPRLRDVDSLIERVAGTTVPKADYPIRGIHPKARKVWSDMMNDKNFVKHLRQRQPGQQWALAHYIFTLKALNAGKKPFSYWTPGHEKVFQQKHEKIQLNLKHKRKFEKENGESPESYKKRTGKCPIGFIWLSERKRCIHKKA